MNAHATVDGNRIAMGYDVMCSLKSASGVLPAKDIDRAAASDKPLYNSLDGVPEQDGLTDDRPRLCSCWQGRDKCWPPRLLRKQARHPLCRLLRDLHENGPDIRYISSFPSLCFQESFCPGTSYQSRG